MLLIFLSIAAVFLVPVVIALAGLAPENTTVHHGDEGDEPPDSTDEGTLLAA